MNTSIFIPKRINVGFQNRKGTYTGKLAYVIYYDERGKLRKETSWNNWRDQNIPNEEFDNVPTEGFVLNKKVGDYSTGWDHRHAYCRVYDPRGFEFEITIENLLYILENTSAIKGKGIEGEFVYGWDGKDLILMPTGASDYKEITKFNEIIHNDECIKAKDLIVGATYLTKSNEQWIYMGRFEQFYRAWNRNYEKEDVSCGDKYWFAVSRYGYYVFEHLKTIPKNKFIACSDANCTSKYSEIYEAMECERSFSPYDKSGDKIIPISFEEFEKRAYSEYLYGNYLGTDFMSHVNGEYCKYQIRTQYDANADKKFTLFKYGNLGIREEVLDLFPTEMSFGKSATYPFQTGTAEHMIPVLLKEIYDKMNPVYKELYLQNGKKWKEEYTFK